MQDKLKEIEALLECISKSDFESSEEYRRWVIERQRQLGVKLREGADEILDREEATAYINRLLQKGFKECTRLPSIPGNLKIKARNASIKDIIKEQLTSFDIVSRTQGSTPLEKEVYSYLLKSKSISELRSALNLWHEVKELQKEEKVDEGMRELCESFCNDLEEAQYYKELNKDLVTILTYDDEQTSLAMKVHRLNAEGKGRRVIAKELGISERKTRELLRDYEFKFL